MRDLFSDKMSGKEAVLTMQLDQVTVMVPSYNYAHYLTECVESAASQTGVDVDVAVVDNGSTDNSVDVAKLLATKYPNVRLIINADNQGIITSFNRCRDEVRGEYAVLLCADDCLAPGSLARSVSLMKMHPNVGLVYGPTIDFLHLEEVDQRRYRTQSQEPIVYSGSNWIDRRCQAGTNPIRTPEAFMRTAVIESVGRLDPSCPYTSDLNMWLRIASQADVAYMPGPAQALFRRHGNSFGQAFVGPGASRFDLEQRWRAFERFFETIPERPERARWERTIRRTLASEARYVATRAFVQGGSSMPAGEVDELRALATSLDPDGTSIVEEWGWKLRHRLGPSRSRWFPGFLARPTLRHLGRDVSERRRVRVGV